MERMKYTLYGLLVLLAFALAVSSCSGAKSEVPADAEHAAVQTSAAEPQELIVRTRDFVFLAPDTVAAGLTRVRLVNQGPELHHVWLVRLEEGKTMTDLLQALQQSHVLPEWAVNVGGPNAPAGPGAENSATLKLEAGSYVMLCVIPSADGKPHVMKGMVRPLTVVQRAKGEAKLAAADIVMTLDDYKFDTDKPITAGERTIRIENAASQAHEVLVLKLAPGKSAMDFIEWVEKPAGPPPAVPVAGITGIDRGEVNQITARFTPGEYALICFWPDAKDGKPHFAHGMMKQFRVS